MTVELSDEERKARILLEGLPSDQSYIVIGAVFRAMWSSALTADKIERVGEAMFGLDKLHLKLSLGQLVRGKVLRSRVVGRARLYEVNL